MKHLFAAAVLAGAIAVPAMAQAQGVPGGMEQGAREGGRAAGPVGAVVGGAVGGVVGGVKGVLGIEERPRFRTYVVEQHRPSYRYDGNLRVGVVLPSEVTYYSIPREYGAPNYRYAVVNDRTVLVEPGSRRVVEIID